MKTVLSQSPPTCSCPIFSRKELFRPSCPPWKGSFRNQPKPTILQGPYTSRIGLHIRNLPKSEFWLVELELLTPKNRKFGLEFGSSPYKFSEHVRCLETRVSGPQPCTQHSCSEQPPHKRNLKNVKSWLHRRTIPGPPSYPLVDPISTTKEGP